MNETPTATAEPNHDTPAAKPLNEAAKQRHRLRDAQAQHATAQAQLQALQANVNAYRVKEINRLIPTLGDIKPAAFWAVTQGPETMLNDEGQLDPDKVRAAHLQALEALGIDPATQQGPRDPIILPLQGNQQDNRSTPRWGNTF